MSLWTICISLNFDICDLRSRRFCDLSIDFIVNGRKLKSTSFGRKYPQTSGHRWTWHNEPENCTCDPFNASEVISGHEPSQTVSENTRNVFSLTIRIEWLATWPFPWPWPEVKFLVDLFGSTYRLFDASPRRHFSLTYDITGRQARSNCSSL